MREIFDFDPVSGNLFWKVKTCDKVIVSAIAGCESETSGSNVKSYMKVRFDGHLYLAHRVIWALVHGIGTFGQIDHKDGNSLNNSLSNLRESNQSQNAANMRKKILPSTGYRGVYAYGKTGLKFEAKAMKNYKHIRFGVFDNPERAYAAYCEGMKSLFGQFASVV